MFSTLVDRLTGILGQNFVRIAVLPSLLFLVAIGLVGWLGVDRSFNDIVVFWQEANLSSQILATSTLLLAAMGLGLFLTSNSHAVIQMFEGYGAPRWLRKLSLPFQEAVIKDLDLDARLLPKEDMMPTKLGNILRSAEFYPMFRYGIHPVSSWPKLYPVISPGLQNDLAASRQQLELSLNISTYGLLFSLTSLVLLPSLHSNNLQLLGVCVISGLLAWIAGYNAALGSALAYSALIKASYDLHRIDLLRAIGYSMPPAGADESRLWARICDAWLGVRMRPPTDE